MAWTTGGQEVRQAMFSDPLMEAIRYTNSPNKAISKLRKVERRAKLSANMIKCIRIYNGVQVKSSLQRNGTWSAVA